MITEQNTHSRARRRGAKLFMAALMVSTPLLDGAVSMAHAQVSPPNSFICYDVKRTSKFSKIEDVHLVDQFNDLNYDVKDTRELCTPAGGEQLQERPFNGAIHLQRYKLEADGNDSLPQGIAVLNDFGSVLLDTKTGDKLMVPASKDLSSQPGAPDPSSHQVNHFHCYDVELSKGQKFPKNQQITLSDQFTSPAKTWNLVRPEHLCMAVDKNGEGLKETGINTMLCYKVEKAKNQPKHKAVKKVRVTDQLAQLTLDTKVESEVCVPSSIFTECILSSGPCSVLPCCFGCCFEGSVCTSCDGGNP